MLFFYRTTFLLTVILVVASSVNTGSFRKSWGDQFARWLVAHPDEWKLVPQNPESTVIAKRTPEEAKKLMLAHIRANKDRSEREQDFSTIILIFTSIGWIRENSLRNASSSVSADSQSDS